jgi:hypothetical protein
MNAADVHALVGKAQSQHATALNAQALEKQKAAAEMARTQVTQAGENAREGRRETFEEKKANGFIDDPANQALVDRIGTGREAPERIAYLATRNAPLLEAVSKKYPDFDSTKAASYIHMYKDFISGKTSVALNSGGTVLNHLKELSDLNTAESHIPHTPAYTAYRNKATQVASELARFYGNDTVPGIKSYEDTLLSTLPGNRQAAIGTQAKSMGDKFDSYEQQWKNGAPSSAYEAAMPSISAKGKIARAALDPEYGKRLIVQKSSQGRIRVSDDGGTTWQVRQ